MLNVTYFLLLTIPRDPNLFHKALLSHGVSFRVVFALWQSASIYIHPSSIGLFARSFILLLHSRRHFDPPIGVEQRISAEPHIGVGHLLFIIRRRTRSDIGTMESMFRGTLCGTFRRVLPGGADSLQTHLVARLLLIALCVIGKSSCVDTVSYKGSEYGGASDDDG